MQMGKLRVTWMFQALADETRLRVVRLLASSGESLLAGELSRILCIPASHLSRHLQVLETAGLIQATRDGRFVRVELSATDPAAQPIVAAVLALRDEEGVLGTDLETLVRTHNG